MGAPRGIKKNFEMFGTAPTNIGRIIRGERYTHIPMHFTINQMLCS